MKSRANPAIADALAYLTHATKPELEQFEMMRLARAANIAKEITSMVGELVRAQSEALVARVLIERERVDKLDRSANEILAELIPELPTMVNGGRNGTKKA